VYYRVTLEQITGKSYILSIIVFAFPLVELSKMSNKIV